MEENTNINRALLVMDVQAVTITMLKDPNYYLHSVAKAINIARSNHIPIIYAVLGFRKGYPEVSPNNRSFFALKNSPIQLDEARQMQIPASIAPRPEDIVITKKRTSAFAGSDLAMILKSLQIQEIVLAGISTSGVVLSTLREASDMDYAITVLVDCCEDLDDDVQQVLMTKVFPRHATVIALQDWH